MNTCLRIRRSGFSRGYFRYRRRGGSSSSKNKFIRKFIRECGTRRDERGARDNFRSNSRDFSSRQSNIGGRREGGGGARGNLRGARNRRKFANATSVALAGPETDPFILDAVQSRAPVTSVRGWRERGKEVERTRGSGGAGASKSARARGWARRSRQDHRRSWKKGEKKRKHRGG